MKTFGNFSLFSHFNCFCRRNNLAEVFCKFLSVLIVIIKGYLTTLGHNLTIVLIFVLLAGSFYSRRFLYSSVNSKMTSYSVSLSAVSLWISSTMLIVNFCGIMFENAVLFSAIGLIFMVLALKAVKSDPDINLLKDKIEDVGDAFTTQRLIEKLLLTYSKAQDGVLEDSLNLGGYIEGLQRNPLLPKSSPLYFMKLWRGSLTKQNHHQQDLTEVVGGSRSQLETRGLLDNGRGRRRGERRMTRSGVGGRRGRRGNRGALRTQSLNFRQNFGTYSRKEKAGFLDFISQEYIKAIKK